MDEYNIKCNGFFREEFTPAVLGKLKQLFFYNIIFLYSYLFFFNCIKKKVDKFLKSSNK